jgi:L-lactate utilization protein LutC
MEYFNQIKNRRRSSQIMTPSNPVLNAEEEAYLQQLTAQSENAPEASVQNEIPTEATKTNELSQQSALNETSLEAQSVPLPTSPLEELGKELGEEERKAHEKSENIEKTESQPTKTESTAIPEKKKKRWSTMFWRKNTDSEKVRATHSVTGLTDSNY